MDQIKEWASQAVEILKRFVIRHLLLIVAIIVAIITQWVYSMTQHITVAGISFLAIGYIVFCCYRFVRRDYYDEKFEKEMQEQQLAEWDNGRGHVPNKQMFKVFHVFSDDPELPGRVYDESDLEHEELFKENLIVDLNDRQSIQGYYHEEYPYYFQFVVDQNQNLYLWESFDQTAEPQT